jgi:hypothetical protein
VVPSDCASFACASTVCRPERTMATPAAVAAATAAAAATRTRRAKPASRALAASISRLNRPKPLAPASPTPSSSARTCRPPTAARRTLTLFSAMGVIHLFVELGHHHRFDDGQKFGHGERRHAERVTERERRRHVPADHGTRQHAQLATETADKVPDLPTLRRFRTVQPRRAVRAGLLEALVGCAGLAVSLAPAEGPFGESAETFFSCSSNRPLET